MTCSQPKRLYRTIRPRTLLLTGIMVGTMLLLSSHEARSHEALALTVSPSSLTFSAAQGGVAPAAQIVTLSTNGGRERSWTLSAGAPWMTVSPSAGTIASENDQITVNVNPAGLSAGTYPSSLVITTTRAKGRSARTAIPVTLTIQSGSSTADFSISPPHLQYSAIAQGPNVTAGVTITNTSSAPLTVTWRDNISWLVATSGDTVTMAPGGSAVISHTASPASLWSGNFTGIATVTGGGITKQVPVSMTVSKGESATPAIGLSTTTLVFVGTVGGTNPAARTVTISNTGAGTLAWTASDSAAWLTLAPSSGTNAGVITATANLAGLAAGTYTGAITVAANGATTKTIPVTLTVNTATTSTSSATLSWVLNKETDLSGYKVYVGTQSGVYNTPIDVGKVVTYQVLNLAKGNTYFFAITAYDTAGNESSLSAEVSKSVF